MGITLACSFCGDKSDRIMIAGTSGQICIDCIRRCIKRLIEKGGIKIYQLVGCPVIEVRNGGFTVSYGDKQEFYIFPDKEPVQNPVVFSDEKTHAMKWEKLCKFLQESEAAGDEKK